MQFRLLDSLSLPGDPAKPNEDALGHRESGALVMDGATGLADEPLMPGKSDAAWLSAFGTRRVLAYLGDGASGPEAVAAALFDAQTSFEALRKRPPIATYEKPFASMMLTVVNATGFDAYYYGDCGGLVKRPGADVETLGVAFKNKAHEAQGAVRLAKATGRNPATVGRDHPLFLEALRNERNKVNTGKGHWLFGPDVASADHLRNVAVKAPPGTIVLLATDGFLALATDYGRYDAAGLIAAAQARGLKAMGEELRAIEAKDPEGVAFPRFKTSDDATAVLLELS